jgi:hypothetical protein
MNTQTSRRGFVQAAAAGGAVAQYRPALAAAWGGDATDTGLAYGYSAYVRARRRLANGLTVLASYTWLRSESNTLSVSTAGASQITSLAGAQNAYNKSGCVLAGPAVGFRQYHAIPGRPRSRAV